MSKCTGILSLHAFGIDLDAAPKEEIDAKNTQRLRAASIQSSRLRAAAMAVAASSITQNQGQGNSKSVSGGATGSALGSMDSLKTDGGLTSASNNVILEAPEPMDHTRKTSSLPRSIDANSLQISGNISQTSESAPKSGSIHEADNIQPPLQSIMSESEDVFGAEAVIGTIPLKLADVDTTSSIMSFQSMENIHDTENEKVKEKEKEKDKEKEKYEMLLYNQALNGLLTPICKY
jgi:hypothetical protein